MHTILFIIALPFLIWLWLGIAFTTARYVFVVAYHGDYKMSDTQTTHKRAKLIRYEELSSTFRPGMLSYFDADTNIQHIDRQRADLLPEKIRERLEVSELPYTKLTEDGLRFVEYPY
jgi:hypothetical protein